MPTRRRPVLFEEGSPYLDRFGLLLTVVVAAIVVLSLVDLSDPLGRLGPEVGWLATTVLVAAALLLALRSSGLVRPWRRAADALVGIGVASMVVVVVAGGMADEDLTGIDTNAAPVLLVLLSLAAPLVVVRRLLSHREVTRATLLGAVSAYLLIPVAFFYAFSAVEDVQGTPFFGRPEETTSVMYFSLSTVTTVGYGDLTPVSDWGRLLASTEAIVGQVYLVTFVAMLVSLFATRRQSHREP